MLSNQFLSSYEIVLDPIKIKKSIYNIMKNVNKEIDIKIVQSEKKIVTDNFHKCGKCEKFLIYCLC